MEYSPKINIFVIIINMISILLGIFYPLTYKEMYLSSNLNSTIILKINKLNKIKNSQISIYSPNKSDTFEVVNNTIKERNHYIKIFVGANYFWAGLICFFLFTLLLGIIYYKLTNGDPKMEAEPVDFQGNICKKCRDCYVLIIIVITGISGILQLSYFSCHFFFYVGFQKGIYRVNNILLIINILCFIFNLIEFITLITINFYETFIPANYYFLRNLSFLALIISFIFSVLFLICFFLMCQKIKQFDLENQNLINLHEESNNDEITKNENKTAYPNNNDIFIYNPQNKEINTIQN